MMDVSSSYKFHFLIWYISFFSKINIPRTIVKNPHSAWVQVNFQPCQTGCQSARVYQELRVEISKSRNLIKSKMHNLQMRSLNKVPWGSDKVNSPKYDVQFQFFRIWLLDNNKNGSKCRSHTDKLYFRTVWLWSKFLTSIRLSAMLHYNWHILLFKQWKEYFVSPNR